MHPEAARSPHADRLTGAKPGGVGEGRVRRTDGVGHDRRLLEWHTLGNRDECRMRDGDALGPGAVEVGPHHL